MNLVEKSCLLYWQHPVLHNSCNSWKYLNIRKKYWTLGNLFITSFPMYTTSFENWKDITWIDRPCLWNIKGYFSSIDMFGTNCFVRIDKLLFWSSGSLRYPLIGKIKCSLISVKNVESCLNSNILQLLN